MKPIYYLVTVLLETGNDSISDLHHLYASYANAQLAFKCEVADCQSFFEGQTGQSLIDLQDCREWRNAKGHGFTVTIEPVQPK